MGRDSWQKPNEQFFKIHELELNEQKHLISKVASDKRHKSIYSNCLCDYAFDSCTILTSITIPDSVTEIVSSAFSRCSNLTDIYFNGTIEEWNAIEKGGTWDYSTGSYTVQCTDGDIAKE